MHIYADCMRTTIEMPENLRKKCIHVALERNLSGFSEIVVEALETYFRVNETKRKVIISELRGSLTKQEATFYRSEIQKSRKNWKQK